MAEATEEKTEAQEIISNLRSRLEGLRDAALQRVADAEEQAERQEGRYWEARGELESAKTRLRNMREEHSALPLKSHTARMRGQEDYEKQCNDRFTELESLIPADEVLVERLAGELDELTPGSARALPEAGAALVAFQPALEKALSARSELEALQHEISELVDQHVREVSEKHVSLSGYVDRLNRRVSGAYRSAGYRRASEVPSHGD